MRHWAPLLTWIAALSFHIARPESLGVDEAESSGNEGSPSRVIDILENFPGPATSDEAPDSEGEGPLPSDVPPSVEVEPQSAGLPPWVPVESIWVREGWYAEDSGIALGIESTQAQQPTFQELPPRPSRPRLALQRLSARVKRNKLLRWFRVHFGHIMAITGVLAAGVLVTGFYVRRRDNMRFLTTTRLSIADKEVQRACNYIERNYADPRLSAESICDALVSGTAFLQVLFHRELGMGLEDFIAQVRMNRARIILGENSEVRADELAASVGYEDTSLFDRKFLEITGVTVEDYRAHV
jgi:AraC-like DNA-binding protein